GHGRRERYRDRGPEQNDRTVIERRRGVEEEGGGMRTRSTIISALVVVLCLPILLGAQTVSYRRVFTGTAQPATCNIGDQFIDTSTHTRYDCNQLNTWSASGGGGITTLTGDVTAGPGSGSVAATVVKVNGVA